MPSRLPTQSSTLYSNNITKFLLSMTPKDKEFGIDLSDEVVRGAIVTQNGEIIPPAPPPAPPPTPTKPVEDPIPEPVALTPWQKQTREIGAVTAGMGSILALGKYTSPLLMSNAFTFALASLIGYRVVWGVAPALHSPLTSVTNAISGMVGIGGLFILGGGFLPETIPQSLGALSVLLAFVNVGGGFVITKRMLDMFKSECLHHSFKCCFMSNEEQGLLIRLSTHGYMQCQLRYSVVVLLLPPLLALLVWSRLDTSLAPSCVSVPSLALPRRRPLVWATCWEFSVLEQVFWLACSLPAFLPRS